MNDLIAELERAQEGSRLLDEKIALVVGLSRECEPWRILKYTTSLDAALTLVPNGMKLLELGEWSDGWYCKVGPSHKERAWKADQIGNAALALCIASLKATQAQALEKEPANV